MEEEMRIHPISTGLACVCATLMTAMLPSWAPAEPIATIVGSRGAVSAAVSYADLNLTSTHGQRVLNDRVWSASVLVCRQVLVSALSPMRQACTARAFKDAEPQIAAAIDRAAIDRAGADRVASRSGPTRILVQ